MKKTFVGKKIGAGMLAGFAIAATLPSVALAGIGEELTIAQTHALLAYRSGGRGTGAGAKPHLQHVLNCLVGPGGILDSLLPPDQLGGLPGPGGVKIRGSGVS